MTAWPAPESNHVPTTDPQPRTGPGPAAPGWPGRSSDDPALRLRDPAPKPSPDPVAAAGEPAARPRGDARHGEGAGRWDEQSARRHRPSATPSRAGGRPRWFRRSGSFAFYGAALVSAPPCVAFLSGNPSWATAVGAVATVYIAALTTLRASHDHMHTQPPEDPAGGRFGEPATDAPSGRARTGGTGADETGAVRRREPDHENASPDSFS